MSAAPDPQDARRGTALPQWARSSSVGSELSAGTPLIHAGVEPATSGLHGSNLGTEIGSNK
jgi:hypothetical protein